MSSIGKALFGKPKKEPAPAMPPPPPPPAPMPVAPMPDERAITEEKLRKSATMRRRSGRMSTILSEGSSETLG